MYIIFVWIRHNNLKKTEIPAITHLNFKITDSKNKCSAVAKLLLRIPITVLIHVLFSAPSFHIFSSSTSSNCNSNLDKKFSTLEYKHSSLLINLQWAFLMVCLKLQAIFLNLTWIFHVSVLSWYIIGNILDQPGSSSIPSHFL